MPDEPELSKTLFNFRVTKEEREILRTLGKLEGSESNALRRAIRMLMEARGLEVPEGAFTDKEAGNRLPKPKGKENPLPTLTTELLDDSGPTNTVASAPTLATAL